MKLIDNLSKTNWKFIAIVAVLGLVVGGGIVWYANLPTPASQPIEMPNIQKPTLQQTVDTSTWQTYRNDEFGFEMKYPKDWILSPPESVPPADRYGWSSLMISDSNKAKENWVVISTGIPYEHYDVGGKTRALTPQEEVASTRRTSLIDYSGKEEKITVGGKAGIKFVYAVSDPITHEQTLFTQVVLIPLDNTKIFEIVQNIEYSKKERYEKFFNQILSTFRFVEKKPSR